MLSSLFPNHVVIPVAKFNLACDGNGEIVQQFAPACERRINIGETYVAQMDGALIGKRHCRECALSFLPSVTEVEPCY